MDEERAYRMRVAKYVCCIVGICYFIGLWYATQSVAEACNYNKVLGWHLTIGGMHLYPPFAYFFWARDELLTAAIPGIIASNDKWTTIALFAGALISYGVTKNMKRETSHGSAEWASAKDIDKSDLGMYCSKNGGQYEYKKTKHKILGIIPYTSKKKIVKTSGVVIGVNPYTHNLMLHDGPEHILLMAPTRSGKGVNTIIPTGLIWSHSIMFFDPKGELWANTAMFRKKFLHQKVLKFEPLCTDGSAARWNPLAEINFRTFEELSDVSTVVSVMAKPNGEKKGGGDPFWDNSAIALLNGVIMHLLYKHYKEKLPLPCPTDIMSFLSTPGMSTKQLFKAMGTYPHITPDEFLEKPILNEDGSPKLDQNGMPMHIKNPLKEIYGEYIKDYQPFNAYFGRKDIHCLEDIRLAILDRIEKGEEVDFQDDPSVDVDDKDKDENPLYMLLTHPKVAEEAANMSNGAEQTVASIMQTAQTALAIYQDPVVQSNTAVSDFAIRDLLDPKQEVSMYLVMQVKDIQTVKPIARLFINTLLNKLIRDMKFGDNAPKKKQRLLLMLDEFPQLGNMQSVELALAICAGYGIKMCIVCQDINQLNKEYTKDNSIASNCHVHVYFTPNLEAGGSATSESISKNLGKKTIHTTSHSDGGGGFFKGSDSTSSTGRELMTADEVSHMSSEKEIVFVAGHKPIFGDKLRFYKHKMFTDRTKLGAPVTSDIVTQVQSYKDLFAVHAAEQAETEEKKQHVLETKAKAAGLTVAEFIEAERRAKLGGGIDEKTPEPRNGKTPDNPGQKEPQDAPEPPGVATPDPQRTWRSGTPKVGAPSLGGAGPTPSIPDGDAFKTPPLHSHALQGRRIPHGNRFNPLNGLGDGGGGDDPMSFQNPPNGPDGYHPILVPSDKRQDPMGNLQPIQEKQPEIPDLDDIQDALGDTKDPDKEPSEPSADGEIPDKPDFLKGINWQLKQKRKEEDNV